MAVIFKHRYKSDSLIGTGAIKFRPYTVAEPLPQLSAPANVSADGTTVSWDEVENATSYAVLADGSEIGTVENVTEDALAGTWVFNDTVGDTGDYILDVSFTSNNITFSKIIDTNISLTFDSTEAYNKRVFSWTDEAYKTIVITSKLSEVTDSETLLTWLQANATKQ